jgi:hypothetical protein
MAVKPKRNQPATGRRTRNSKLRAALAPAEDRAVRIPEASLPRLKIRWTDRELASLAEHLSAPEPHAPTEALVRAVRE